MQSCKSIQMIATGVLKTKTPIENTVKISDMCVWEGAYLLFAFCLAWLSHEVVSILSELELYSFFSFYATFLWRQITKDQPLRK